MEPHLIGNEPVAGESRPVQSALALLNPLLGYSMPVVEAHHIFIFSG